MQKDQVIRHVTKEGIVGFQILNLCFARRIFWCSLCMPYMKLGRSKIHIQEVPLKTGPLARRNQARGRF
jgi:hypothetical protein